MVRFLDKFFLSLCVLTMCVRSFYHMTLTKTAYFIVKQYIYCTAHFQKYPFLFFTMPDEAIFHSKAILPHFHTLVTQQACNGLGCTLNLEQSIVSFRDIRVKLLQRVANRTWPDCMDVHCSLALYWQLAVSVTAATTG